MQEYKYWLELENGLINLPILSPCRAGREPVLAAVQYILGCLVLPNTYRDLARTHLACLLDRQFPKTSFLDSQNFL